MCINVEGSNGVGGPVTKLFNVRLCARAGCMHRLCTGVRLQLASTLASKVASIII